MRSRWILWIILLVTLLAIFIDLPKLPVDYQLFNKVPLNSLLDKFPLKLGLDLQGGTELVLRAETDKLDPADRDDALQSARSVIEKRVNLFGVSEAIVQTSKIGEERRILVQLPGVKDSSEAAQLVGKTAQLDFRELPATASAEASPSAIPAIFLAKPTGLTGADVKKARVSFGGNQATKSGPQVEIEFSAEGAEKFAEITRRNVGKPVAIFLDNDLISAPTVQQEIVGGNAVITGDFNTDSAKQLAIQLNAGSLRVPLTQLSQFSIPPNLGQQSIQKSLVAGVIGLLIVMLYMAAYYKFLGVVADLALIIYALISLAVFKTGLFILPPVTLTLAGIAGFILSIGMAVDANILIFERMNEELRWGKSKVRALELGFDRAWSSIWASNVSSLMTAAILYGVGTSLVRGFAVTLAIGILVSLFTAIIVTRTFLRLIVK